MADDDLRDFERTEFTHDGTTRTVFRRGTGPPSSWNRRDRHHAEGSRLRPQGRRPGLYRRLPHLFGIPGLDPNASNLAALKAMGSALPSCISKEFTILATGKTSPVVDWLRAWPAPNTSAAADPASARSGMCFPVATPGDGHRRRHPGPVLSQPSLPLGLTAKQRRNIDISPADLEVVKGRCAAELNVIGMRFDDKLVRQSVSTTARAAGRRLHRRRTRGPPTPIRMRASHRTRWSPST